MFCAIGKGLTKVDLKDENIVEIVAFATDICSRVTSFKDRLYYTDSIRSEVVCCDINGTILWTFTDKSALNAPSSITVDDYGHVYVVGANPVNVIVISPDGKEHRQLLSKADRLTIQGHCIMTGKQSSCMLPTQIHLLLFTVLSISKH